jgi:hypothetical protein
MTKMNTPVRHRLALWLSSALLLALLSLAGCGLSATRAHVFTAAEILQNATNVLDVSGTAAAHPASSATVKDLTFTMKFTVSMDLSSSSQGKEQFTETMTATGKETLAPRRTQMDMSMAMDVPGLSGLTGGGLYPLTGGQALTMNTIVDYDSQTAYIKSSLFDSLLKGSSDTPATWYKMPFASVGDLGVDTSMYIDYSKLKNAKLIGSETINGVAVWHLRAIENIEQSAPGLGAASARTTAGSVGLNATTDYYFRKDNYRPVKVVISGTDTLSGPDSGSASGAGTMTMNGEMDFTSFNTGISISLPPPSEVKSLTM